MVKAIKYYFLPRFYIFFGWLVGVLPNALLITGLAACGSNQPLPSPPGANSAVGGSALPAVQVAWPPASVPVVAGSYIVAFAPAGPDEPENGGARFFDRKHATRSRGLQPTKPGADWQADPRLTGVHYLGELSLAKEAATTPDQEAHTAGRDPTWSGLLATPERASVDAQAGNQQASLAQLEFVSDEAARDLLADWAADSRILFAEPNYVNELYTEQASSPSALAQPAAGVPGLTPPWGDAAGFGLLADYFAESGQPWWMEQIHMGEAFGLLSRPLSLASVALQPPQKTAVRLTTVAPVVIAVLDSGVDYKHPALLGKIWRNPQPGSAGCLDDKWGCDTTVVTGDALGHGSAYPFSTSGPDEACPTSATSWQCMHGTHVAGILVADLHPGGAGLCPVCKVLPIKAVELVDGEGKVTDGAILRGLQYIRNLNAQYGGIIKVVNSSFGKFQWSRAVALQIAELRQQGVLFVAAAGNENSQLPVFPAALREALAVTAVDATGRKSDYANYGAWVDVAAPGGSLQPGKYASVTAPVPGQGLMPSQGTSVATPMVSGVAALLWAVDASLTVQQVHTLVVSSANGKLYESAYGNGYNQPYYYVGANGINVPLLGSGLLDARAALLHQQQGHKVGQREERVQPGCASLGGGQLLPSGGDGPPPSFPLFVWLSLPLIMVALRLRRGHESCK